jgi:uncharacterized protein (TIGR02391 family)
VVPLPSTEVGWFCLVHEAMGDNTVLGRSPEELIDIPIDLLAALILRPFGEGDQVHEHNILLDVQAQCARAGLDADTSEAIARRAAVAWGWLRREGYVATTPGGSSGWEFVTAAHRELMIPPARQRAVRLLREADLNRRLNKAVFIEHFQRGTYGHAVFWAMREVEKAVRESAWGTGGEDKYGQRLMAEAFGPNGPLAVPDLIAGEARALQALFSGAYGWFRDPAAHRSIEIDDPQEAAEVVLLANLLLRLVDRATISKAERIRGEHE